MFYRIDENTADENLVLEEEAPRRYETPSVSEIERHHGWNRCIGGDKGDLLFDGFSVQDGKTYLYNVALCTSLEDLTQDEVIDIATETLFGAYESVGTECVC